MKSGREAVEALPDTLKVGPFDYTIEKSKDLGEDWGLCETADLRISINPDHPSPAVAMDTMLHEMGHAIWKLLAPERKMLKEEEVCALFATGFTMILRDNPKFRDWLVKFSKELE